MNQKLYLYISIFSLVILALLVGNRFGTTWSGGEGAIKHATVTSPGGQSYERGEIVSWEDVDQIQIGEATVWLDENTEVKLVSTLTGEETINVVQGRIVVIGVLQIEVRELDITTDGTTSFVHYSWLNEIEIANLDGSAELTYTDTHEDISGKSLRATTLTPYQLQEIQFDPESSTASGFYKKVLE